MPIRSFLNKLINVNKLKKLAVQGIAVFACVVRVQVALEWNCSLTKTIVRIVCSAPILLVSVPAARKVGNVSVFEKQNFIKIKKLTSKCKYRISFSFNWLELFLPVALFYALDDSCHGKQEHSL